MCCDLEEEQETAIEKGREKRTKLEVSTSLTSDYTTKLQKSKQHGTGMKTDT